MHNSRRFVVGLVAGMNDGFDLGIEHQTASPKVFLQVRLKAPQTAGYSGKVDQPGVHSPGWELCDYIPAPGLGTVDLPGLDGELDAGTRSQGTQVHGKVLQKERVEVEVDIFEHLAAGVAYWSEGV